jgi:hypothetical protein
VITETEAHDRPWPVAEHDTPALPRTLRPVTPDEAVQIFVTPTFRRLLDRWLTAQGLVLFRMPVDEADLPTYGITFGDLNRAAS